MRIGIDIDDTVANTNELLIDTALVYDKEYCGGLGFNKANAYKFDEMFYWNDDQIEDFFMYFMKTDCYDKIEPKMDAIYYINKLKKLGCLITFITYRQSRDGYNTYDISKRWLDKFGFSYDKLIADSGDKGLVCKNEGIDLFIDDSVRQVDDVKNNGVKTLLFNTVYNKYAKNYDRVNSWEEIYNIVRGMLDERGDLQSKFKGRRIR